MNRAIDYIHKFQKFFANNYFLIVAFAIGICVSLFISRLLSLEAATMGLPGSRTWIWRMHNPYFDQVWLVLYGLFIALIVATITYFSLKSKRLWFLSILLICVISYLFSYIFFLREYMDFQLAWWGNAGYPEFGVIIARGYNLKTALREFNGWILHDEAKIGQRAIGLFRTHVATHPPGAWMIYWAIKKLFNDASYVFIGYAKILLNLIIIFLSSITLKKYFVKETIILFTVMVVFSPHLILFGTYPDTIIYALMIAATAISIKISENYWWGILLGTIMFVMMIISFGAALILIYVLIIIYLFRKKSKTDRRGIYLLFLTIFTYFIAFKLFGYDYIYGSQLAQINHYALMEERNLNNWFLFNIYDLMLFAGLGISVLLILIIANYKFQDKKMDLSKIIALAGGALFILVMSTGGIKGEAGRIAGFVMIPFYLFLADQISKLIRNKNSFILSLIVVGFLSLHSFLSLANSVYPVTESPNHEKAVRSIYKNYPGYLPQNK